MSEWAAVLEVIIWCLCWYASAQSHACVSKHMSPRLANACKCHSVLHTFRVQVDVRVHVQFILCTDLMYTQRTHCQTEACACCVYFERLWLACIPDDSTNTCELTNHNMTPHTCHVSAGADSFTDSGPHAVAYAGVRYMHVT